MSKQKKAWIYARVDDPNKNELLSFQIDLLTQYAHENNYSIIGSTRAFDLGNSMDSLFMKYLVNSVIAEWMDCILVYSNNRLLIDQEKLDEFELICRMHNVSIITIK